jgi:hypothetical protein
MVERVECVASGIVVYRTIGRWNALMVLLSFVNMRGARFEKMNQIRIFGVLFS